MILTALHDVFVVLKWLFGFGALMTLLGIGLVLLWFVARAVVMRVLRNQSADRFPVLRKLFLELVVSCFGPLTPTLPLGGEKEATIPSSLEGAGW